MKSEVQLASPVMDEEAVVESADSSHGTDDNQNTGKQQLFYFLADINSGKNISIEYQAEVTNTLNTVEQR